MNGATGTGWLPWALLSATFAAVTAILAKLGVQDVDSNLATLVRTTIIAFLLGVALVATGKLNGLSVITSRSWLFLSLSAIATGSSWICYFRALKLGPAARVAPVDKLSVVFVALLGTTLLGEQLSWRSWFGVALIAAGSLCVALG